MKLTTHRLRFEGIPGFPLMTDNPQGMSQGGGPKGKGAKKEPSPEEQAKEGAYETDDGYGIPKAAFRSSLMRVLTGKKVGKSSARSIIEPAVFVNEEVALSFLLDPKTGKYLKRYEIDTRRIVTASGSALLKSRPKFLLWACELDAIIDEDMIDLDTTIDLWNEAGQKIGVGSYRVKCPKGVGGPFGKYSVGRV